MFRGLRQIRLLFILSALLLLFFPGTPVPGATEGLVPGRESSREELRDLRFGWQVSAVQSAIENGFIGIARSLLQDLIPEAASEDEEGELLQLDLEVSLISGNLDRAGIIRNRLLELGDPIPPLLEVMYLHFSGAYADASRAIERLDPEELRESDRAWYHLIDGLLASRLEMQEEANAAFLLAERLASSALKRDHFEIIRLREALRTGDFSPGDLSALRESVRSMRGERGGFEAARLLAIALQQNGRPDEAIEVLTQHLALPGLEELGLRSEFLLLMGRVAGPQSPRGRLALTQLINDGLDEEAMKTAFAMLTQQGPELLDRTTLMRDLDAWLDEDPPHPLAARMRTFKAYLLILNGRLDAAEEQARLLLNEYPESAFAPFSLRLLAQISWSQSPPRYRTAADYLNQLRDTLPDAESRSLNGIRIGDCFFLNADYRSASDAYAAALQEAPGPLAERAFFQQVLAEIRARRPANAARLIDRGYTDERLGVDVLWRAEWNLMDHWRTEAAFATAFARMESLMAAEVGGVSEPPITLRLRMRWLQARLSLEVGEAALARDRALALLGDLEEGAYETVPDGVSTKVEGHLLLLLGEALFALGDGEGAGGIFSVLRERFPDSGPTVLSYLVQSRAEAGVDNLVAAQQSLVALVDRFPESEFAPIALWEAALNAEQRGLPGNLQEAISLLERMVTEYPTSSLVYYARLKQGDLARRLNDFPTALLLYERVLSAYPDHPDRFRAEMSRGDCLMALGVEDPGRLDAAAVLFERNCLLPSNNPALRIEAGYKWAHALRLQGDLEGSASVLWLLVDRFIIDSDLSQPIRALEEGRYWMSRTLLTLAREQKNSGQVAEAVRLYEMIVDLDLAGVAVAKTNLEALR